MLSPMHLFLPDGECEHKTRQLHPLFTFPYPYMFEKILFSSQILEKEFLRFTESKESHF